MLSMKIDDPQILLESWQLLMISYMRRSYEVGNIQDVYHILSKVKLIINRLPSHLVESQLFVLNELLSGFKEVSKYNYKNALIHFQAITPSRLTTVCLIECQRLILLCHVQLAENLKTIAQYADDLYTIIESQEILEDEQFCRSALVLMDVYIDRVNDPVKVNKLKNRFIKIIQNHFGCIAFEEFEACYNRKAALYFTAAIASRQTLQSVCFYKNHYNRNNLYMSLCNHAGNSLIYGDYNSAKCALNECQKMIDNDEGWYYPSQYKVSNNLIILKYLIAEKEADGCYDKIVDAAKQAANSLFKLLDYQSNEVSYVVLLNYISLSIMCNENNWSYMLDNAYNNLFEIDEYYQYYLHDLMLATHLLNNRIASAQKELSIIDKLNIPLLKYYRPILKVRKTIQQKIIVGEININGNAVLYNNLFSEACSKIQDSSCNFFGRGFLLSDLQFLSL